ncbi:MAG: hypothetical protein LBJ62_02635 [Bifidobacteriaceae bacterium]|nr:hypothetical protein [Bifidobacteriaceae bacterium]
MKDPDAPVSDGWATLPAVKLPWSISEAELRELVGLCPPTAQPIDDPGDPGEANDPGEAAVTDPVIQFAEPDGARPASMTDQEIQRRVAALQTIIAAAAGN